MNESNKRSRLGWILIIIGSIFLARNLDVFDFEIPYYLTSWQMILILVGLVLLFTNSNKGSGISLVIIGGFFLINDIYDIDMRTYWPLILVVIGIAFLLGRGRYRGSKSELTKDYIDEIAIFGGGDRIITSQNFQGGKLTAMFGGIDVDMRESKLGPGNHTLDVFTMFGGVSIKVPEDLSVKVSVVSILGGFSDERRNSKNMESNNHLEIKGFVMFGGGSVES